MTAFGNAFKAARKKAGGGGGTFMFGGKKYSTKTKDDGKKQAYDIKSPSGGGPALRKGPHNPAFDHNSPAYQAGKKAAYDIKKPTGGGPAMRSSHPATAAVHKANVKNTAPGAQTKFQFDGPPTLLARPGAGTPKLLKRGK